MERKRAVARVATAVFFIFIFVILASRDANKKLDHDEHQFIASGKVLSQSAALPYMSYPYFHAPNLILIYALLFRTTSYALLAARLFSATCATLTLGLIFLIAFHLFSGWSYLRRFLMAAGIVLLIVANPIFAYTSGFSWNHDLPVLLTLAAFLVHCQVFRANRAGWWMIVSGGLFGSAVGTRLSFAPAFLPFLVAIPFFLGAAAATMKLRLSAMFIAGAAISMVPLAIMFGLAPRQFIFGNLGYAGLNTLYRAQAGYETAMSVTAKFVYLGGLLEEPVNLLLFVLFLLIMLSTNPKALVSKETFEPLFAIAVALFLLVGSLTPTPSFYQYFYAPIPFVVVALLYAMEPAYKAGQPMTTLLRMFACIVFLSSIMGFRQYADTGLNLCPKTWVAVKIHNTGQQIKRALGKGRVLTLAPIFPLEGGLEIYSEFVTGPFAWRVAPLMPAGDRRALGLVSASDLPSLLSKSPPDGILVGLEGRSEKPLVEYATENGYEPQKLSNGSTLWLARPSR